MDGELIPTEDDQRQRMLDQIRAYARPFDLDALVADGVLAPAGGLWYRVVDTDRVPTAVWKCAESIGSAQEGGISLLMTVRKANLVQLGRLYEALTGREPPEDPRGW